MKDILLTEKEMVFPVVLYFHAQVKVSNEFATISDFFVTSNK